MNYELYFWCLVCYCFGRMTVLNQGRLLFYIGYDEEKYKSALGGILLRK